MTLPRADGEKQVATAACAVSLLDDRAGIVLRSQCPELYAEVYQHMVCLAFSCRAPHP